MTAPHTFTRETGLSREIGETLLQADARIRRLYWVRLPEPDRNCIRRHCGVNILLHPTLSPYCKFEEQTDPYSFT